jgi:cyclohexa-1,5-dienecarbonyl-CoA hydratase
MMAEIEDALDVAEYQTQDRAVLITGTGARVFSAGVEIADHSRERVESLMVDFVRLLRRLGTLSLPTVAGLNGATLGGGLELALACDMMVAVPDAKIGFPEIKLASIAFPGILMLQGRIPPNRIVELLAGGDSIDGVEAYRMGMVNRLIGRESFDADVTGFMGQFTRLSRPVLKLMMRTLKEAKGKTLDAGFDAASRIYLDELLPLEDVVEGLSAYAEKRSPIWKHR